MISDIVRSLGITLGVSALISSALYLLGVPFWVTFILSTAIQIFVWQGFQYIVSVRAALTSKEVDKEMMETYMSNSVEMPCAYCKEDNFVPIKLNTNNSFMCSGCDKETVVYIHIDSVQRTVPVESLDEKVTININELK